MLLKFPPFRIDHFKLLILHFALFTFLSAGAPDTLWTRIYGGDDGEEGSSVQQTADGGFIIAGTTHSFGADSDDVYLIQTDSNGDTLWTRTYGGYYKDWGNSVKQTNDSGFIITGMTQNIDSVYGDVFLIRTDSNGDTLWTKTYGGEDSDQGHSVQQTSDGGFIIVGNTWHLGTDAYNVYLVRTNLSGDTLWTRSYGGNDDDFGYSVQQTTDSGFIIVGSTSSFGAGGRDVYLIKINSKGDSLWTKTYGDTENDQGYSVMQTIDGGFIITGSTSSFSARITNVYLIKTDSNGDTLWTKIYRSNYMGEGCSVQQLSDGGFIIAGVSESFGLGSYGVYIIRTNSEGDTIWTNTYGGTDAEAFSIQQTSDGGFIIVGSIESISTGWDVYLVRLDKEITGIHGEIPSNFIKPNDFIVSYKNNLISIRYTIPYSTSVKLEAYDIKGKLVKVITNKFIHKGSYSVNWNSKRFGSGVYFLKLSANGSAITRKVTIIK